MTDVVWVLRHGQSQDAVDDDWHETTERVHDPGLTDRGRRQARCAAERVREEAVDEIYASPFLRAVQTAALVAEDVDGSVYVEPGLGEHLNPEWFDDHPETLGREELVERFPRIDADYRPLLEPTFPEDRADAELRIGEAARRIVDNTSARRVLFVGHGATVGGVTHGLAGSTGGVDTSVCGLTKLVREGNDEDEGDGDDAELGDGRDDWRLVSSGDVAHLER